MLTTRIWRGQPWSGGLGESTICTMAHDVNGEPELRPAHGKGKFLGFFERVDNAMRPIFGPPKVTVELDGADGTPADLACPVCGHAMTEHAVDRELANSILYCPAHVDTPLEPDDRRLNELGMIKLTRPE